VESLGEKLKTVREERGLSYEYVSSETNISAKYLEALEREDFSGFPGEPYLVGFLRNYGDYLGINTEELLSMYRSLKLQEQPIPVEQLLKGPSRLPKIIGIAAIAIAVLGLGAGAFYFISRLPKKEAAPQSQARTSSEYSMASGYLERRLYPGDSILAADGTESYKLVFTSLGDAVAITTPRGPVMLDLGQELTVDLNNDGLTKIRIAAADFVKNDSSQGALLRFELEITPQPLAAAEPELQMEIETVNVEGREAMTPIYTSQIASAQPFTLQALFQGYCLFRYEILSERDRQGRQEQYYQRSEEINIAAQNGIRLGISNAQSVKLQAMIGGKPYPFEIGGAGEVVAAEVRWVRDEENRYRLVLLRLE